MLGTLWSRELGDLFQVQGEAELGLAQGVSGSREGLSVGDIGITALNGEGFPHSSS